MQEFGLREKAFRSNNLYPEEQTQLKHDIANLSAGIMEKAGLLLNRIHSDIAKPFDKIGYPLTVEYGLKEQVNNKTITVYIEESRITHKLTEIYVQIQSAPEVGKKDYYEEYRLNRKGELFGDINGENAETTMPKLMVSDQEKYRRLNVMRDALNEAFPTHITTEPHTI